MAWIDDELDSRKFDVTDPDCIADLVKTVQDILIKTESVLHAVVNNAASLVLARLEWQTQEMIQGQIQVRGTSLLILLF